MSTINISLPADQVTFVDRMVKEYGFANRSELVRSVFRFLKREPTTLAKASTYPLRSPDTRSRKKVINSFKATGLYNKGFLRDLEEGLDRSDFFTEE